MPILASQGSHESQQGHGTRFKCNLTPNCFKLCYHHDPNSWRCQTSGPNVKPPENVIVGSRKCVSSRQCQWTMDLLLFVQPLVVEDFRGDPVHRLDDRVLGLPDVDLGHVRHLHHLRGHLDRTCHHFFTWNCPPLSKSPAKVAPQVSPSAWFRVEDCSQRSREITFLA